jgi:hypothetical protein
LCQASGRDHRPCYPPEGVSYFREMTRLNRTTYANVASTLALAVAVGGGTAYAAGLVDTDDLKKGAVTTPKIAKDAVVSKKIKNGSVKPADLAVPAVSDAVVRSTSFTFPEDNGATGQILTGTAVCESGEKVLSGGYGMSNNVSTGGQPNVLITEDRPATSDGSVPTAGTRPEGWYVKARRNVDTVATTVTVWVLCG